MSWNRLTKEKMTELAQQYAAGETMIPLMKRFRCGTGQLYKALGENGVAYRSRSMAGRVHAVDETVFAAPLTSAARYWLGFIATDGCVVANPGSGGGQDLIALKLASKDRKHVEAFKAFLKAGNPITDSQNVVKGIEHPWAMLRVSSQKLCNRLAELGITKRKTFTLKVSDELAANADFWRGAIDGDGTIGWSKGSPYVQFVSASKEFLDQFCNYCKTLGVQPHAPGLQKKTWRTSVNHSEETLTLLKELYPEGSFALQRKKDSADVILRGM